VLQNQTVLLPLSGLEAYRICTLTLTNRCELTKENIDRVSAESNIEPHLIGIISSVDILYLQ